VKSPSYASGTAPSDQACRELSEIGLKIVIGQIGSTL
jgi:hypothetical protein